MQDAIAEPALRLGLFAAKAIPMWMMFRADGSRHSGHIGNTLRHLVTWELPSTMLSQKFHVSRMKGWSAL